MFSTNFKFGRTKTLGIEPQNNDKVLIKIPLESGVFWEREYLQNDLIGTVVNDFKKENNVDIPKDYMMDWSCKNKSLKMTDKIKTLIVQEVPTIFFNPEMKKKPLQIQEEEIIPQVVGKPFSNPFEIFLFKKSDKLLKIQTYDENIINKVGLNNYSPSSSYCNGNNQLFISGGENDDCEMINKLWQIDLVNNSIYDPIMISPKKNHSMIFIPPDYVFIVGGNDKRAFYFDSDKRELIHWADLNIERIEPALQRIGNTLYCFDNINKMNDGHLTFEKTDLNAMEPEWNLLYPKMDPTLAIGKLPQKFFGVSKDLEQNIIFLGGNMDNYTVGNKLINYRYNPSKNSIETSDVPYRDYNFKEKTFLPYNKNIDYILPDFNRQHPEVVFYVKNKSKIEKVNYKPNIAKENLLRGRNRVLFDSKYDFNMPLVTFPNKLNNKININDNIKLKAEPKNISPYASKDIHEPSFQEFDFNANCRIEQPPPFKEPEIEANQGDTRLSIEIPNLNEKKELKIGIKEEEKNETENPQIKLKAIPRPNSTNNRQNNINVPQYKNEITIPKFHYSVNDPGNELKITSKGKIYTNYTPKETNGIKSSHADFNIKSQKLAKEDLILPNFTASVNAEAHKDLNLNTGELSSKNMKFNGNIDGGIPTPTMHIPQSENININVNDLELNGPKINTPSANINLKGKIDSEYELEGIIPGIKSSKLNTPNVNIKGSYTKSDYSLSGKIPGVKSNLNGPKIGVKGPNINGPDFDIKGKVIGMNLDGLNIDVKGPKVDTDLSGKIGGNIDIPKMDIKSPDYDLKGTIVGLNIDAPKIDVPSGNIKLKGSKIDKPNVNIDGDIPGLKVNASKIDLPSGNIDLKRPQLNGPDFNMEGKIPGFKVNAPKINIPSGNIDLKGPQLNGPDFNLEGNIPGLKVNTQKIDLPSGNIDLKGPKINAPDFNLEGNIPGYKVNTPKIDLPSGNIDLKGPKFNGPDFNMEGNIPGLNVNTPKIDLPSGNIDLKGPKLNGPDFNMEGNIPGLKVNTSKIDIPDPNINIKAPKFHEPDFNIEGSIPGLNINAPKIDVPDANINLKGTKIDEPNINIEGNVQGINVNAPKIDIPSGNINIKGPNIEKKEYYISGIIPGMKKPASNLEIKGPNINGNYNLNVNGPDINSSKRHMHLSNFDVDIKGSRRLDGNFNDVGLIPGMNIKGSRNINGIDSPNIKLKGPNINGPNLQLKGDKPDVKLKGDIPDVKKKGELPNMKIDAPKIDIKSPNIDLKGPDSTFKGGIPDVNLNGPKIDTSGNINLKGPNVEPPNINLEGPNIKGPSFNLSGNIPGVNINGPKINANGPQVNVNLPNNEYKLEGIIPGTKSYGANLENNIKLQGPNINVPDFNLTGIIPGIKVNGPNLDTNFKGPKIKSPEIDIGGKIKSPNLQLSSQDVKLNGPNINVPDIKVEGDLSDVKLKGPKINTSDLKVEGDIPDVKIKGPNINLPDLKVKGDMPDVKLKGDLPDLKIDMPKVDIKSPNIDLKGPDYNLKGYIPGVNIKGPNIDASENINLKGPNLKSPNINLENPNIKSPDFNLSGNIPGIQVNEPKIDIPSAKVNVKGPSINSPSFNLSGNINGINTNNKDFVLTGIIPSFRYKQSNVEEKNYKINPDIKFSTIDPSINFKNLNNNIKSSLNLSRGGSPGKRNFHGNLNDPNYIDIGEIKGSRRALIPTQYDINIPKTKNLQISGDKMIDEKDVILQPPFNINPNALMQGQIGPKPDRKSVHLTVSQMQIQPEQKTIEIKVPDINIDMKAPKIENDINADMRNDINVSGGKFDLNTDNKINNIGEIDGNEGVDGNKGININLPKIEIKNEAELSQEIPNINIEKPDIEGGIKINKKEPTNLRVKRNKEINDNNYNINININNENNNDTLKNSIYDEEDNSKRISTSRRKKGKCLPSVGVKSSNFKSSKIDIAGRFDVENVDVNNMKSANVGVNGVKLNDRIIE